MKTFTALLLTLCFISCHAQPSDVEISYLYYLNGHHVVEVTNLSDCNTQVRIAWRRGGLTKDTLVGLLGANTAIIHLPAPYSPGDDIKAKSEGLCPNNGWARISVPQALDVKIVSFACERKLGTVVVEYELFFEEAGDYAVVEKSRDAMNWQAVHYIRNPTERTYLEQEAGKAYYRLHAVSAQGRHSYSTIRVVDKGWYRTELARGTPLYDESGRVVGYFKRPQDLPRGRVVVVEGRKIVVL